MHIFVVHGASDKPGKMFEFESLSIEKMKMKVSTLLEKVVKQ